MPCQLRIGETAYNGLVLDLSASGLFVQTGAKARPGQQVSLSLSNSQGETIDLHVEVVRRKAVPARLVSLAGGGLGVRIVEAPESYMHFLEDLGLEKKQAPPAEPGTRFRVRVKQVSGPRTKRVELEAEDAESAARAALDTLGSSWLVLDVESDPGAQR